MAVLKKITGNAKFEDGEPAIGSKIYLTGASGTDFKFDGKLGTAIVDVDGNWTMTLPPHLGVENRWLKAVSSDNGKEWRQSLKPNQTVYPIDFNDAFGMQNLPEVVISTTRPKRPEPVQASVIPTPSVSWFEKNKLWVFIGSGVLVATTLIVILAGSKKEEK